MTSHLLTLLPIIILFLEVCRAQEWCIQPPDIPFAMLVGAGTYDTTVISGDRSECQSECFYLGKKFSAVWKTVYCFCADDLSSSQNATFSSCTTIDGLFVSTSVASDITVALDIDTGVGVFVASDTSEVTITPSLKYIDPSGSSIGYQYSYRDRDNMWDLSLDQSVLKRKITNPGVFEIRSQSVKTSNKRLISEVGKQILVYETLVNANLTCPPYGVVQVLVNCNLTMTSGSRMTGTVTINGVFSEYISLSDLNYDRAGFVPFYFGNNFVIGPSAAGTHVINHPFQYDGTVKYIELNAATSATINILLLQPSCTDYFCFSTSICGTTSTCSSKLTCTTPYCTMARSCSNNCNSLLLNSENVTTLPVDFKISQSYSYTITSLGYQMVTLPSPWIVKPGYRLGFQSSTINVIATKPLGSVDTPNFYSTSNTVTIGTPLTAASLIKENVVHQLSSIASPSQIINIKFMFNTTGAMALQLTLSGNLLNPTVLTSNINIGLNINDTNFIGPFSALANVPKTIELFHHSGSNLQYYWTFGDGTVANTTVASVDHTYAVRGTYNVSVIVFNTVVIRNQTVQFVVKTAVVIGSFTGTAASNPNTNIPLVVVMTSGEGYNCTVSGDSYTNVTRVEGSLNFVASWPSTGFYNLRLDCYSDVSKDFKLWTQAIITNITGLQYVMLGGPTNLPAPIQFKWLTGSNITFEFLLNNETKSTTKNESMLIGSSEPILVTTPCNLIGVLRAINVFSEIILVANLTFSESIKDLAIIPNNIYFEANTVVNFNVSMTMGTSVNIIIDFNDGSNVSHIGPDLIRWPNNIVKTHTYTSTGTYNVTVTANNTAGISVSSIIVYCLARVPDFFVNNNTQYLKWGDSLQLWMTIPGPQLVLTNLSIEWMDGSKVSVPYTQFNSTARYNHAYAGNGIYNVNVTIFNPINTVTKYWLVYIINPIVNLRCTNLPLNTWKGSFIVYTATLDSGDLVSIILLPGDAGLSQTKLVNVTALNTDVIFNYTYNAVGSYVGNLSACNPLGCTFCTRSVEIQYKINRNDFQITTNEFVEFQIQFSTITINFNGLNFPTLMNAKFSFMDGSTPNVTSISQAMIPYTYAKMLTVTGYSNVTITLSNLANSEIFSYRIGAFEKFQNFTVAVKWGPTRLNGMGSTFSIFPLKQTLYFSPAIKGKGTVDYYVFMYATIKNANIIYNCNATIVNGEFSYVYNEMGDYNVSMYAMNPISNTYVSFPLTIGGSLKDTKIIPPPYTLFPNYYGFVQITWTVVSPDSCICVNLGNGTKVIYGATSGCTNCSSYTYTNIQPINNLIKMTVKYPKEGDYNVSVMVFSALDSASAFRVIPITSILCSMPAVSMSNPEYTNSLTPQEGLKGSQVIVNGQVDDLPCQITKANIKSWTAVMIDPLYSKTIKTIDLTTIPTSNNTQLLIPPLFLDYGLYKLTFTVTMDKNKTTYTFLNMADTYLRIIKSNVTVALSAGGVTLLVMGMEQNICLYPYNFSRDPDVKVQNFNSWTWKWKCRNVNEQDNLNKTVSPKAVGYSFPKPKTGCFGDGPGVVSFGTSTCFSGTNMDANNNYLFEVIAGPGDGRTMAAKITLKIVTGIPPTIAIQCMRSLLCKIKGDGPFPFGEVSFNPSDVLLVNASCVMADGRPCVAGIWKLLMYNGTDFNELVGGDTDANIKGSKSMQMSILPEFFASNPTLTRFQTCYFSQGSTVNGQSCMQFYINPLPTGLTCVIDKTNVKQTEKVCCSCTIKPTYSYRISVISEGQSTILGTSDNGTYCSYIPFKTVSQTYMVRVTNVDGGFADYTVSQIKVIPMDTASLKSIMEKLQSGPDPILQLINAKGDLTTAAEIYLQYTSFITASSQSLMLDLFGSATNGSKLNFGGSGYNQPNIVAGGKTIDDLNPTQRATYENDRDAKSGLVNQMAGNLYNMVPGDIGSLNLICGVVNAITNSFDNLNRQGQNDVSNKLVQLALNLKTMQQSASKDDIQSISTSLLAATFQSDTAANSQITSGIKRDIKQSKDNFLDYDTNLESSKSSFMDVANPEDAGNMLTLETNSDFQSKVSTTFGGNSVFTINTVTKVLRDITVVDDKPVELSSSHMQYFLQKSKMNEMSGKSYNKGRSKIQLPDMCFSPNPADCSNPDKAIALEILATPNNVKVAVSNPNKDGLPIPVATDTVSIKLYSGNNDNEQSMKVEGSKEFIITLSRDPSFKVANFSISDPNPQIAAPQIIPGTGDIYSGPLIYRQLLVMHQFTLNGTDQSVHFQMKFNYQTKCTQFLVVGRLLQPPSLSTSPDGTTDPEGGFTYWGMIPTNTKYCTVNATENDPDPFTFYVNNTAFTKSKASVVSSEPGYSKTLNNLYFGVRELLPKEYDLYTPTNKPPYPYPYFDQINTTYKIRIYSSGCLSNSDDFKSAWTTSNCTVGPLTTPYKTQCICTHLTTFVSGFIVAPNTIDFNYVFSNFDLSKNSTLFITEGVVFLFFILLMIWARRQDVKDLEKLGVSPLDDNDSSDMYLYEIIVDTSIRNNAGTKSKVYFILSGESDETEARRIDDSKRTILQRGNVNRFLLAVPRTLGPLQYIRLWHDNSGKGPNASWYCNYFGVTDLQTKEKFHFLVNSWFAVEEDDGQVDRLIAVASAEELLVFGELFARKMKQDLTENHLWLSIMARPPESRFTRVERVACCLLLMFLTMLTTCMFYQKDGPSKSKDNALVIGPLAITPREVWIGLVSGIIGFLPLFIVMDLFRRSQLKHGHANKLRQAVEDHLDIDTRDVDMKATTNSTVTLIRNEDPNSARLSTPGYRAADQINIEISESDLRKQENGKDQNPEKKVVRKRLFPWWARIFVWGLLVSILIVACFFTTLYGIQFGDMACKKWISSMFISFFASVLLIQPVKVVVLAVFFTLVCKKSSSLDDSEFVDEDDELMNELGQRNGLMQDEEYLHQDLYTAPMKPHRRAVRPPSKDDVEKAREARLKEMKMYDIIREITFYIIFFTTLLLVTYSFRDPNAYNIKTEMEKVFVTPWNPDWNFADIRREDQFWDWALKVLVPALRAPLWYNNDPQMYQRGFISDRNNRLMGYAVMRQVRVKKDSCTVYSYVKSLVSKCFSTYNILNEDKGNYSQSWEDSNTTVPEFSYQTATQLNGMPYLGAMNVYSGGGYVYQFRTGAAQLFKEVSELKDNRWLDFQTRAIFIEFTTYNPNINLFAICTFLLELPGSGGMWPSYRIEPANLLGVYSSGVTAFEIFCQVLYGIFIVFMIVKEIRNLMKQKWTYFKQFWNWIDIFLIGGSFGCVFAFIYIRMGTSELTSQFENTAGDSYMKFQYVAFWNEYMGYLTSFIVFAATLKFMKLLRFNRRIGMLGAVLSYCSKDMKQFFIIFMIMFLAFVMVFYCLFMDSLDRYHTFLHSTESSMQIALGKFEFLELYEREPIFGPIVFAFYVIFIIFVMLNMFIAILNEGFAVVRADVDLQSNDFEIVDFMMTKIIMFTGITNTRIGQKLIKTSVTDQLYKEIDEREIMAKVNSFPDKVDQLLNHINHIVCSGEKTNSNKKPFSNVIFENPSSARMKDRGHDNVIEEFQVSRPATATSNILRPSSGKEMPNIE